MTPDLQNQDILVGTLVPGRPDPVAYVRQILPHGFESFSITFGSTVADIDFPKLAAELRELVEGKAVISSVCVYGNPLETETGDVECLRSWETVIDNARLFGCDIVGGFAGRLRGKPIDESIPRFKEVFAPLAKRAADKGVRIAFENCDMGGDWKSGDYNIAHNPTAWEMMFDAVPAENLGLQWEPCHQMVSLIDPMPQLRRWVKKIFHLHGKCCTIKWDIVREFGVHGPKQFAWHRTPGFGDCNWTDIVSELRAGGFKGSIDIEGWHDPVYNGQLEMTGQVRALNYLKDCRGGSYIPNPA